MLLNEIAQKTRLRLTQGVFPLPPAPGPGNLSLHQGAGEGSNVREAPSAPRETPSVSEPEARGAPLALAPLEEALSGPGISFICEVKRASPSRGIIAEDFPYMRIAAEYEAAGAAAISVLTEPDYFLGKDEYLRDIAAVAGIPVLRKDFVIDPCQIYEAQRLGAQAILLICALLDRKTLEEYLALAGSLGLSCLTEVHTAREAAMAVEAGARIIGINNRDLETFQVDLSVTKRLRKLIPPDRLVVSESGIRSPEDIRFIRDQDVQGVLIGESLMRAADKKRFLAELREAGNGKN